MLNEIITALLCLLIMYLFQYGLWSALLWTLVSPIAQFILNTLYAILLISGIFIIVLCADDYFQIRKKFHTTIDIVSGSHHTVEESHQTVEENQQIHVGEKSLPAEPSSSKQEIQDYITASHLLEKNVSELKEERHRLSALLDTKTKEVEVVKSQHRNALRDRDIQESQANDAQHRNEFYKLMLEEKDKEIAILREQDEQNKNKFNNLHNSIDDLPINLKTVLDAKLQASLEEQRKVLTDAASKQFRVLVEQHEKELQARDTAANLAQQKLQEAYNTKMKQAQVIVQKLQESEEKLRSEVKNAQVTVPTSSKSQRSLELDLKIAENTVKRFRETNKTLRNDFEESQVTVQKLQKSEEKMRKELEEAQVTVQKLQESEEKLRKEVGKVQVIVPTSSTSQRSLEHELKMANKTIERFRETTNTLRDDLKEAQATVQGLRDTEKVLREEVKQAQVTVPKSSEVETALRHELHDVQATAQRLSESERLLRNEVAAAQATVQALHLSDKELRSSLTQTQLLVDKYKRVADMSQSGCNDLEIGLRQANARIAELSSVQEQNSRLQNRVKEFEQEFAAISTEYNNMQQNGINKDGIIAEQKRQLDLKDSEIVQKDQIVGTGMLAIQELTDTKAHLEKALDEARRMGEQQGGTQNRIRDLEKELAEKKEDYAVLKQDHELQEDDLYRIEGILMEAGAEKGTVFDHVTELDKVIGGLEESKAKCLRDLLAARNEIDVIKKAAVSAATASDKDADVADTKLELEMSLNLVEEERDWLRVENAELRDALRKTRTLAKPVSRSKPAPQA